MNKSTHTIYSIDPWAEEFDIIQNIYVRWAVIMIYSLVIIFGFLGNVLVVVTVIKSRQLHTATNVFIAGLATSDAFVCIVDLPLNLYYQINKYKKFARSLCKFITFYFATVCFSSSLFLLTIAADRYRLIVTPTANKMSIKMAFILSFSIFLISCFFSSPIAVFSDVSKHDILGTWLHLCRENWNHIEAKYFYSIASVCLQYFFPMIAIGVLYHRIYVKLGNRMVASSTANSSGSQRRSKTTKMIFLVVTTFAIFWLPFHVNSLATEFSLSSLVPTKYIHLLDSLLKILAMSTSCVNPVIYGFMNDNYRAQYMEFFRYFRRGSLQDNTQSRRAQQSMAMDRVTLKGNDAVESPLIQVNEIVE